MVDFVRVRSLTPEEVQLLAVTTNKIVENLLNNKVYVKKDIGENPGLIPYRIDEYLHLNTYARYSINLNIDYVNKQVTDPNDGRNGFYGTVLFENASEADAFIKHFNTTYGE